ncbi:MAG TPA: type II secretion system F family protein [Nitriliruptoraceae bacterium]|nr:type II secretion system F family protein [Nitriliruptoraceae bacterium]
MIRIVAISAIALWAGLVLILHQVRWFSREPLDERLAPYVPGGMGVRTRTGVLSVESFAELVGPIARSTGESLARVFGISEDLDRKLRRIHSDLDVTQFRVRQVSWALAGLVIGTLFSVAIRPGLVVSILFSLGGALLAFMVLEQQIVGASDRWKRSLFLELPVVAEQTAMLLGAGYSMSGAIERVSTRGHGAVAQDLRRVLARIRQGADEQVALDEWAELSDVEAVERFTAVLNLNREATDLGRLIAEEARSIRRDVQRELIETMERRSQQVWIPVTVATLVPGVIFVAIPFASALEALNL